MNIRPILMSAPMVRAILAGMKTQTRRVVKPQPEILVGELLCWKDDALTDDQMAELCPYGNPGDRLWVRETWMPDPPCDGTWGYTAWAGCREGQIAAVPAQFRKTEFCNYRASWQHKEDGMRWTPAIHMPRWASRITLEVTGVRVERLQDISEADCAKEGAPFTYSGFAPEDAPDWRGWYSDLWESINGPESWDANPWVWCVEFKRLEAST